MDRYWGYVAVITATVLFGVWNTFSKILLVDLSPLSLSALVYLIAGIFLFLVHFSPLSINILNTLNRNTEVETGISKKNYIILFTTIIAGAVIAPLVYLNGLDRITAVNASLLLNVEILFIIIIGILFLKEGIQKKDILGFSFLIIGTIFLATNGDIHTISINEGFGSLLVIVAAFFWSIDTILSKFLSNKKDLVLITALKCFLGGFILFSLSLAFGLSFKIPINHLPYLFFIGIFSIGIAFVLIYFAIRQIGSTRTGSLFALSSLFGAVFAFTLLKEPFTIMQALFGILMILGVFIIYKSEKRINSN
jgi:drug/metabolite transporter (DMT)-like permease